MTEKCERKRVVPWRTISDFGLIVAPQGSHSEPLNACTRRQKLGIRKTTITQSAGGDNTRVRRKERKNAFCVSRSFRKGGIYRGKNSYWRVRQFVEIEILWLKIRDNSSLHPLAVTRGNCREKSARNL